MPATLPELRALPHLSISQLKVFLGCPRKYRLQYVDRAEPMFRSVALAFGSAWHAAIDEFLLRSTRLEPTSTDELKQVFASEFDRELNRGGAPVLFDDEHDHAGRLVDTGIRMIDAFAAAVAPPERVFGVEVPFGLELVDPDTGEVLAPLVGAMDAVVREDGADVVWELKTAKRRWGADQLAFDLQPTAYRLAARQLGYDAVVRLLVTTKTRQPEVQLETLVRGRADEDDLLATAASVVRAIAAGVDHPVRGWQCRTCPFSGACR